MANPADLTQQELDDHFPVETKPVVPGRFEIGLVLGGTVSAGAYTGGVLDYLIEALDAWHKAKQDKENDKDAPEVPPHEVVITTVGGTSGGAINGAILLRAMGREFDHGASKENPFFDSWTQGVDLMGLLSLQNDKSATLSSLFNAHVIEEQADATIKWNKGRALGSKTSPSKRTYLADPLRLLMMVGNVTGVPYRIPLMGDSDLGHDIVSHADYLRFALSVPGGTPQELPERQDELPLKATSLDNWNVVREASLATSAFPLAFRGRELERALKITGYRALAIPSDNGLARVKQLVPRWELLPSKADISPFANVDGGTFNNEPLDVVRTAMAGLGGRNARDPQDVTRAVILIDPFSDAVTLSKPDTTRLIKMIGPLITSMIQQPRFKPADLALAYDESSYSRYLIAPTRRPPGKKPVFGKWAIAAGGLGGFLGFVDAKLLIHDYALGRANAHAFLRRHLVLPEDKNNPLFDRAWWTEERRARYGFRDPTDGKRYLPIIPLMDGLRDSPPAEMPWPKPTPLPANFEKAVDARLDAVYAKLKSELAPSSWWQKALLNSYLWIGWNAVGRSQLRKLAVATFTKALKDQDLD